MSTDNYPHTIVHPGEILKEELETRGISQEQLSEIMDIPYTMLDAILNCQCPISSELAKMFESTLGINAMMLCNMQSEYDTLSTR